MLQNSLQDNLGQLTLQTGSRNCWSECWITVQSLAQIMPPFYYTVFYYKNHKHVIVWHSITLRHTVWHFRWNIQIAVMQDIHMPNQPPSMVLLLPDPVYLLIAQLMFPLTPLCCHSWFQHSVGIELNCTYTIYIYTGLTNLREEINKASAGSVKTIGKNSKQCIFFIPQLNERLYR